MKAEPRGRKHERPSRVQENGPTPGLMLQGQEAAARRARKGGRVQR